MTLRLETAGESHGPGIVAWLAGLPRGVPIDAARIEATLDLRRRGWGRSSRQKLEDDRVEWLGGVRGGRTTGAPVSFRVPNRDDRLDRLPPITRPRPGHADLAGMLRFGVRDARDVLERASARETVVRVVAGALAAGPLEAAGTRIVGFVRAIGGLSTDREPGDADELRAARDASAVLCPDPAVTDAMVKRIDEAKKNGDTLGGLVEVVAADPLPGLGSVASARERLDGRLAGALMSLPAVKGVEIGLGFAAADLPGSGAHDEIVRAPEGGLARPTNRAGGIEGGMTNGEPVVARLAMKPLPTLMSPLRSVDLATGEEDRGHVERADVCAVPALSVIAEATVALVLLDALLERTGGTTLDEVVERAEEIRRRAEEMVRGG